MVVDILNFILLMLKNIKFVLKVTNLIINLYNEVVNKHQNFLKINNVIKKMETIKDHLKKELLYYDIEIEQLSNLNDVDKKIVIKIIDKYVGLHNLFTKDELKRCINNSKLDKYISYSMNTSTFEKTGIVQDINTNEIFENIEEFEKCLIYNAINDFDINDDLFDKVDMYTLKEDEIVNLITK